MDAAVNLVTALDYLPPLAPVNANKANQISRDDTWLAPDKLPTLIHGL